jgi:nucleotide-binding universal stress UspA family protein
VARSRILVPVDGSACAVHALEYAGRRQHASGDLEIIVLNVQPSMRPSRTVTRELIEGYQARNSQAALRPALATIKRFKLNATCHKQIGNPAAVIVALHGKRSAARS